MIDALFVGSLIGGAWVYNLYCWVRGFKLAAYAFAGKPQGKFGTGFFVGFLQLVYTLADIAMVGVIHLLIGSYAASLVPAAVISILVSWQINRIRVGKSNLLKPELL